jgi:hypothetical protein
MSVQSDFENYRRPFREIRPVTEFDLVRRAVERRERWARRFKMAFYWALVVAGAIGLSLWILGGAHL